ncbi:hypothetical protein [Aquimarina muelleri]|uniref:Uncharacterized protein n=1 Tax=Aquimarina muelleri TaxID=279356 RepID=A0A918JR09_9FLAO|nr:hypothetical protein [Aquimarina muelleri]MCX2762382.1 hypothetical protein [Aquimarina muelleri]GGX03870.1 hypothetical protein GCM10007384_02040 [Aquimarina muelleri]
MLDFLNETNWWCLLLLLFLAFLLGWLLSRWSLKKKYKKALEDCEKKNTLLKSSTKEKANSTFSNSINLDAPASDNDIKAIKTRDHGGISVNNDLQKPKLNFDSFGKADASQKDDLKLISGVGTFIEEKLNSIGIYTFDQISKFTKEDIETVTTLIQFFPGRIERDKWTEQALKLKDKK